MRTMEVVTGLGVVILGIMLLGAIVSEEVWSEGSEDSPSNSELAQTLLIDWAYPMVAVGVLLTVAITGAAYLVRDEREENLLWDEKGEVGQ